MSNAASPQQPAPQPPARLSGGLLAGGALVVALGFGLPALFGGAAGAPAAPTKPAQLAPEPLAPPSAGNIGLSLLKLAGGLVAMCAVCVLVAKCAAPKPATAPQAMAVAAALRVGACTVQLVVAGDRRLLVGTDASGVKAVLELPPAPEAPPAEVPAAQDPAPAEPQSPPSQAEIIQLLLKLRDRTSAPG